MGSSNVTTVTFGSFSQTSGAFSYSLYITPVISSLSTNMASPVLKGAMSIFGYRFGNDPTKISVYLDKNETLMDGAFELSVTFINDT